VPSLSLPDPERPQTPATLAQCEAAGLFVERARLVEPAYELTGATAPAVAQICRRLDGIPLAIELADARVRVLTAEQIAARLDEAFGPGDARGGGGRFRLLTGGGRTALRRHLLLRRR
jgi:predicted ATPase